MKIDIEVRGAGQSVLLLVPFTKVAEAWFEEHIGQDNGFQPYWPTVTVEARYVGDILRGAQADGLVFSAYGHGSGRE